MYEYRDVNPIKRIFTSISYGPFKFVPNFLCLQYRNSWWYYGIVACVVRSIWYYYHSVHRDRTYQTTFPSPSCILHPLVYSSAPFQPPQLRGTNTRHHQREEGSAVVYAALGFPTCLRSRVECTVARWAHTPRLSEIVDRLPPNEMNGPFLNPRDKKDGNCAKNGRMR
jgi:hypothetical protein